MGKKTNPPGIKLTLKTAKELAKRELGTAKGLTVDGSPADNRYYMALGNLVIHIHPEQIEGKGYIAMIARWDASGADKSVQIFDPNTLEKDFAAADRAWRQDQKERFWDWVLCHGVEYCRQKIKEALEK